MEAICSSQHKMEHSRDTTIIYSKTLSDPLCPEDRALWETVVRDVCPLSSFHSKKNASDYNLKNEATTPKIKANDCSTSQVVGSSAKNVQLHILNFDRILHRKIAQGHLRIEARIDLHGLTQKQAYSLLLYFVQSAQSRGLRYVLVVTGKGISSGSDGILRENVPYWLETVPFRLCVHAFKSAARHHGGNGALYIKLRRLSSRQTS